MRCAVATRLPSARAPAGRCLASEGAMETMRETAGLTLLDTFGHDMLVVADIALPGHP
nr:hypothetical protein GCM10020063_105690 [Dactylosporangium thailandense]